MYNSFISEEEDIRSFLISFTAASVGPWSRAATLRPNLSPNIHCSDPHFKDLHGPHHPKGTVSVTAITHPAPDQQLDHRRRIFISKHRSAESVWIFDARFLSPSQSGSSNKNNLIYFTLLSPHVSFSLSFCLPSVCSNEWLLRWGAAVRRSRGASESRYC